jgi:hypothetical protein
MDLLYLEYDGIVYTILPENGNCRGGRLGAVYSRSSVAHVDFLHPLGTRRNEWL